MNANIVRVIVSSWYRKKTRRNGLDQEVKNFPNDSDPGSLRAKWCVTKPKMRRPRKFGIAKVSSPKSPN
jgi:hypothetical protein